MKVSKIGHCCLVIEHNDTLILTDPGSFSTGQNKIRGLSAVLITHEHADHFHIESLKTVLNNNPGIRIITNNAVHSILEKEGISSEVVGGGESGDVHGIEVRGFGTQHEKVFGNEPNVENTGYLIGNKLFYPGDALHNPGTSVDILALPVSGPWLSMSDALAYARELAPQSVFPVHEGLLNEQGEEITYRWASTVLEKLNIKFIALKKGSSHTF